jgi:hypothetical protein
MLMLDKEPNGLDNINNKSKKNRKTKIILSNKKGNRGF